MKKIFAYLMTLSILSGAIVLPVEASAKADDFVINRVWLSNQSWQGGEELDILVNWRYVGDEYLSEWKARPVLVTDLVGIESLYDNADSKLHSKDYKKDLDQTSRINRFVPHDKDISFTLDIRGEKYPVKLSSMYGKSDAEVMRLEVPDTDYKIGDDVELFAWVKNEGTEVMGPEEFTVTYTVNGVEHNTKTSVYIQPGERKRVYIDTFTAAAEKMYIELTLDSEGLIDEGREDNNSGYINVASHKTDEDFKWSGMVYHGGGCVRHIHSNGGSTYMRSDMGGVYKYNYDFEMWENLTSDLKFEGTAAGEAFRVVDPAGMAFAPGADGKDIIFIIYGHVNRRGKWEPPQLLRSLDGGKTWDGIFNIPVGFISGSAETGSAIEVDPNNPNIVWIRSVSEGVFYTENALDAAPVWNKVTLPDYAPARTSYNDANNYDGYTAIGFDKTSVKNGKTQTVYISTWSGGVYRSLDGGKTFEHMQGSPNRLWEFAEGSDGRVYGCVFYDDKNGTKGVWRLDSGSDEWENYLPVDKNVNIQGIDVADWDDNVVGVCISSGEIKVSHDGGKTWGEDLVLGSVLERHNHSSWNGRHLYPTYFAFDSKIKGRIFFGDSCGSIDDIYATPRVRRDRIRGLEELLIRDIVKPKGLDEVYFTHQDGGFSRVSDMFEYETLPRHKMANGNNAHTVDYCAEHPQWVFTGGAKEWYQLGNPCLAYSNDEGKTMTDMQPMLLSETVDEKTGKVTKKGASISNIAVSAGFNKNGVPTLVAYSTAGIFQRTEDLGKTWENINCPFTPDYYGFDGVRALVSDKRKNGVFYVMDKYSGVLYKSTDDGKSFKPVSSGWQKETAGDIYSMVFDDGLLWGTSSGLEMSFDGGKTFTKCEAVQSVLNIGSGVGKSKDAPEVIYILGTVNHEFGAHMSEDMGKTWIYLSGYGDGIGSLGWWGEERYGIDGDKERYGVVYVGTNGMGVMIGMQKDSDFNPVKIKMYNEENVGTRDELYEISGRISSVGTVTINHNGAVYKVNSDDDGYFGLTVKLDKGNNSFTYTAGTEKTGITTHNYNIIYDPNYLDFKVVDYEKITNKIQIPISGKVNFVNPEGVIWVGGKAVKVNRSSREFSTVVNLVSGVNNIAIEMTDGLGGRARSTIDVMCDITAPAVKFVTEDKAVVNEPLFILKGTLDEAAAVSLNGAATEVWEAGEFERKLPLGAGENTISLVCTDIANNTIEHKLTVNFVPDEEYNTKQGCATVFKGAPVIDGDLSDAVWRLDRLVIKKMDNPTDDHMLFSLASDGEYLYLGARVWDEVVWQDSPAMTCHKMSDALEAYIDAGMERAQSYDKNDQQIAITRAGAVLSAMRNDAPFTDTQLAVKTFDDGYAFEVKIALSELGITYAPGGEFGFDLAYNDADKVATERSSQIMWFGAATNWKSAVAFGTAVFED